MASISVLLYFGGKWTDSFNYVDYSIRGIMVALDCSYDMLLGMISRHLGKDEAQFRFTLQYQVYDHSPPVPICDDISLQFYLEMKRDESDKRRFPICVDIDICNPEMYGRQPGYMFDSDHNINTSPEVSQKSNNEYGSFISEMIQENLSVEEIGKKLAGYVNQINDVIEDTLCTIISKPSVEDVKQGSVFKNKDLVVTSVALYAINNHFQFSVVKSDTKFYWLKCIEDGCNWIFKSSRTGYAGNFKIREISKTHGCSMDSVICDHKQATSFVIANCIKHNFLSSSRIYTAGDIREDMHHTYGVVVSYDKAWRARDRAIKMIRGDLVDSFRNLSDYLHRLEVMNPGSYTRTDSEGRFLFSFVALGASIAGWKHCKPVIVVDGTFLTSRYGGTLFTACTQDANNNIYILAFGVGDGENNNAWTRFLLKFKEAYGDREELCIVSDRHGSIGHAVDQVFPNALHGACTYHLLTNLKKEFGNKGKGLRIHFNAASRAYTTSDFETHMRELDVIDPGIRGYLKGIGFERWSRAHMTKDRYSTMTSNIAESVNSAIKHAKNYPIEALHECLRFTMQKWFFQNLSDARSTFTRLATRHDTMLNERIKKSRKLRVQPISDIVYQVNEENLTYVVDMSEMSCSCRRFQLDHIPCSHAVAVIAKRNYSLSEYCSKYFTKEEYIATYQASVYPLGNKEDWHIPDDVKARIVLAPMSKRGPGRPKESRFKSLLEYKKRTRCSKCDSYGHNTRTCSNSEIDANWGTSKGAKKFEENQKVNGRRNVWVTD